MAMKMDKAQARWDRMEARLNKMMEAGNRPSSAPR